MTDDLRLIEAAFPLKQASIDSVHEKNVRHGHISTLHIWPARRPLAACRAALIATLLPDPGTPEERRKLCEKIGGKVVKVIKKKKLPNGRTEEREVEETVGGILHWGRETENKADLDWFRREILRAYGGRAPRVLDPFAGGGAIPLEAMRLGCEATAIDINPVAWFILKCTLEYPQRLAGQKRRLPAFVLKDREFMEEFFKAQKFRKPQIRTFLRTLGHREVSEEELQMPGFGFDESLLEADLAWHVRAWGRWVLGQARKKLAGYYPVYADFEPLKDGGKPFKPRASRLVALRIDGTAEVESLNREFEGRMSPTNPSIAWLHDPTAPRWVPKPAVAYLWARTVRCKNCRATIPLLKTRWLAKKDKRRVLLRMEPNADRTGVVFSIEADVPQAGGNNAIRREHDKKLGQGTMSRAGAWCVCCGKPGTVAMEMEDIRAEGLAGRLDQLMTTVVVDGQDRKEYRLPTEEELSVASLSEAELERAFADVPFGIPDEPMPGKEALGIRVPLYGFDRWRKLFTNRQLRALGALVEYTRVARVEVDALGYGRVWEEGIALYLMLTIGRAANYMSTLCLWDSAASEVKQTFLRFALPITWDFAESNPLSAADRYYVGGASKIGRVLDDLIHVQEGAVPPSVLNQSAQAVEGEYDVVVTDPPYYDAIPYSDLMDFFYIWFRRVAWGLSTEVDRSLVESLTPKWDHETADGELVDDSSRFEDDAERSKAAYEAGMLQAFRRCSASLRSDGRFVVVFANKQPVAWETLVSAVIQAGFVVDGSLPIMTEMRGGVRNFGRASLASSIWLVCKKRPEATRPGWDNTVLAEMKAHIHEQLRSFWDAGIRGPDFVWAATGPAMEAYSKHPIVKKADQPGELMTVRDFLRAVRRIVVDFVVGRVLSEATHMDVGEETTAGLDDVTTYYLLHRHDFGLSDAPAGACILYAVSCTLSEAELADRYDILARTGGTSEDEDELSDGEEADADGEAQEGTGSTFKLKPWKQRSRSGMGLDSAGDNAKRQWGRERDQQWIPGTEPGDQVITPRAIPLIDQVHRLMHLWRAGDQAKVDQYLEDRGLRRSYLFQQLLQALVELSPNGSEERVNLESIMNHVRVRGVATRAQTSLEIEPDDNAVGAEVGKFETGRESDSAREGIQR